MRTYKIILDEEGAMHEVIIIASTTQEAIDGAKKAIGDKDRKSVLFDISTHYKGIVSSFKWAL